MFLIISMYNITKFTKNYIYYYKNENLLNKISFYLQILLFLKQLLIKFTDPDIQTKKSRYPDPDSALTDSTFYYPDPDSAFPDIWIFGSDLGSNQFMTINNLQKKCEVYQKNIIL